MGAASPSACSIAVDASTCDPVRPASVDAITNRLTALTVLNATIVRSLIVVSSCRMIRSTTRCSRTSADRRRCLLARLVANGPPGIHERCIFVGGILPHEVAGVDQMQLAPPQSLVKILGIDGRDDGVSAAGDDLNRYL